MGRVWTAVMLAILICAMAGAAEKKTGKGGESEADRQYEHASALMDDGEWARALEAFEKVIDLGGKNADAAFYWKAYSLKKLGRVPEALAELEELRSQHPESQWLDDARAFELEIRHSGKGANASPESETNEEMKLMAINALMNADPERAVPMLQKLIDSGSSERLKEQALFVLVQTGTPEARETLLQIARGRSRPGLQRKAIEYLGMFGGKENGPLLKEIFSSSTDPSVKRAVLNSYMISGDTASLLSVARDAKEESLRDEAINLLGAQGASEELRGLYRSGVPVETRERILNAMGICGDVEDLVEAARTEKEPRLRRAAIQGLGIGGGKSAEPALLSIYKEDRDLDVRKAVLEALMIQGNDQALIAIARKETNPELKRAAVEKLSVMGSKEATDYMMEILND